MPSSNYPFKLFFYFFIFFYISPFKHFNIRWMSTSHQSFEYHFGGCLRSYYISNIKVYNMRKKKTFHIPLSELFSTARWFFFFFIYKKKLLKKWKCTCFHWDITKHKVFLIKKLPFNPNSILARNLLEYVKMPRTLQYGLVLDLTQNETLYEELVCKIIIEFDELWDSVH